MTRAHNQPPVFLVPLFLKEECFLTWVSQQSVGESHAKLRGQVGQARLFCCMLSPQHQPWVEPRSLPPAAGRHSSCQMKTERFAGVFCDWSHMSSSLKPLLSSEWEVPISSAVQRNRVVLISLRCSQAVTLTHRLDSDLSNNHKLISLLNQ